MVTQELWAILSCIILMQIEGNAPATFNVKVPKLNHVHLVVLKAYIQTHVVTHNMIIPCTIFKISLCSFMAVMTSVKAN